MQEDDEEHASPDTRDVDSDIIEEDDIPEPLEVPKIMALEDEVDAIINKQQAKLIKNAIDSLRIEKGMMLNL